jgi:hypothetical protein
MKKTTVKEIKQWFKTLEENRYKRTYNSDARRVAWMVNNEGVNLSEMPETMRKKWVKAEYKKERYMANKFLESMNQNESIEDKVRQLVRETIKDLMEGKRRQLEIPVMDKLKVDKILKQLKLKIGKDYDIGVGKGNTFILDVEGKHLDKIVTLFMKNRISVK